MKSGGILELLAYKHREDVFVPECKTGPTTTANAQYLRMDAWTMKTSWAHPCATAYEIKVSRSDFIQDNKWPGYLPYCNQFYFVTPWKMVSPGELGSQAGLIWVSQTGSRLFTKIKAPYRDVEIPESIFRYILMSRARIDRERKFDPVVYWHNWLETKRVKNNLGNQVTYELACEIERVRNENERIRTANERLEETKKVLAALGVHTSRDIDRLREEQAKRLLANLNPNRMLAITTARTAATRLAESLGKLLLEEKQ